MKRALLVAVVATAQFALVGVGVAPQLSTRLNGETVLLEVAPVDPMDPFRGAYVDLGYPGLTPPDNFDVEWDQKHLYITLEERDGVAVGTQWSHVRPDTGLYLTCAPTTWRVQCGIDSWFVPQDEAIRIEEAMAGKTAVAEVRIDSRGNAAIVDLRTD